MFIYIKKYVQARLNLCAFRFGRGTHKVAAQSGQSNMFMIILVVAAMAILGSVIVMNYNPNKTKATTMIKSMQAVGGALEMAVLDITCYLKTPKPQKYEFFLIKNKILQLYLKNFDKF